MKIVSSQQCNAMDTTQRNHFHNYFRVDATASRVQSAVTTKKVSKSMEVKAFLKVLKVKVNVECFKVNGGENIS